MPTPVLDYADIVNMPLDAVYHSTIRFITGDLTPLIILFYIKSLSGLLNIYMCLSMGPLLRSCIHLSHLCCQTRSNGRLSPQVLRVCIAFENPANFSFYASAAWNCSQSTLKIKTSVFKLLIYNHSVSVCTCFNCFASCIFLIILYLLPFFFVCLFYLTSL